MGFSTSDHASSGAVRLCASLHLWQRWLLFEHYDLRHLCGAVESLVARCVVPRAFAFHVLAPHVGASHNRGLARQGWGPRVRVIHALVFVLF